MKTFNDDFKEIPDQIQYIYKGIIVTNQIHYIVHMLVWTTFDIRRMVGKIERPIY